MLLVSGYRDTGFNASLLAQREGRRIVIESCDEGARLDKVYA